MALILIKARCRDFRELKNQGGVMKKTIYIIFLYLICSHTSFSFDKSDFDIAEQHNLYKTGGIQSIYNYGNQVYSAERTGRRYHQRSVNRRI